MENNFFRGLNVDAFLQDAIDHLFKGLEYNGQSTELYSPTREAIDILATAQLAFNLKVPV